MDSITSSSILDIYKSDMNNIHCIDDYDLYEFQQERSMMEELLSQTEAITQVSKGLFSEKINNKYVLVCRETLLSHIQAIYKYLLHNKNSIDSIKDNIVILDLCNIFLLNASGNNTIYSLKKKILMSNKNINVDVILSEYKFTQLTNLKHRKGSSSWDYRFFIIKHYGTILFDYFKNQKIQPKQINIKGITQAMNINLTISKFIINDFDYLMLINTNDKRNYQLWSYLNQMFTYCQSIDDKKAIFCFACSLFANNFNDYSAFSFIINFHQKSTFSVKEVNRFTDYLIQISHLNKTGLNIYLIQLCKLLTNK